jgi:hypothetical protein
MTERAMSRRTVLEAGACALVAAAGLPQLARASAETRLRSKSQEIVQKYYAAWETKDWHPIDILLVDGFTFSSPLDDHISKSDFKAGCWDTQIAYIDRFDLKQVIGTDNGAPGRGNAVVSHTDPLHNSGTAHGATTPMREIA